MSEPNEMAWSVYRLKILHQLTELEEAVARLHTEDSSVRERITRLEERLDGLRQHVLEIDYGGPRTPANGHRPAGRPPSSDPDPEPLSWVTKLLDFLDRRMAWVVFILLIIAGVLLVLGWPKGAQ